MYLPSFLSKGKISADKENPFSQIEKRYFALLQKVFSAIGEARYGTIPLGIKEMGDSITFEYAFNGETLEMSFKDVFLPLTIQRNTEFQIARIKPAKIARTSGYRISSQTATLDSFYQREIHAIAVMLFPIHTKEIPSYYAVIEKMDGRFYLYAIVLDYGDAAVILKDDKLFFFTNGSLTSQYEFDFEPSIPQIIIKDGIDFINHNYKLYFTQTGIPEPFNFTIDLKRRSAATGLCELDEFGAKFHDFKAITFDFERKIVDYSKTGWEIVFHVKTESKEKPIRDNATQAIYSLGLNTTIMEQAIKEKRTRLLVNTGYVLKNFIERIDIDMPEIDVEAVVCKEAEISQWLIIAKGDKKEQKVAIEKGTVYEMQVNEFRNRLYTAWETKIDGGEKLSKDEYISEFNFDFHVDSLKLHPRLLGYSLVSPSKDNEQSIETRLEIIFSLKSSTTGEGKPFRYTSSPIWTNPNSFYAVLKKVQWAYREKDHADHPGESLAKQYGGLPVMETWTRDFLTEELVEGIVAKDFQMNRVDFDIPLSPFRTIKTSRQIPQTNSHRQLDFEYAMILKIGNWNYYPSDVNTSGGKMRFNVMNIYKRSSYTLFDLEYIGSDEKTIYHVYFISFSYGLGLYDQYFSQCYISASNILETFNNDSEKNPLNEIRDAILKGELQALPIIPRLDLTFISTVFNLSRKTALSSKKMPNTLDFEYEQQKNLFLVSKFEYVAIDKSIPTGKLTLGRFFERIGANFHDAKIYYTMFDKIFLTLIEQLKDGILKDRKPLILKFSRECQVMLDELKAAIPEYIHYMLGTIPFKNVSIDIAPFDGFKDFTIKDSKPMNETTILEIQDISATIYEDAVNSVLLIFENQKTKDIKYVKLSSNVLTKIEAPPLQSGLELRPRERIAVIENVEGKETEVVVKESWGTITFRSKAATTREGTSGIEATVNYADDYKLATVEKQEMAAESKQTYSFEWSLVNIKTQGLILSELRVARLDGIPFQDADFAYFRQCLDVLNEAKVQVYNFNDLIDITSRMETGQIAIKIYMNPEIDKNKVVGLFANLSIMKAISAIAIEGIVFKPMKLDLYNNMVEGFTVELQEVTPNNQRVFEAISNILFFTDDWKDNLEPGGFEVIPPDKYLWQFTQVADPTAWVNLGKTTDEKRFGLLLNKNDLDDEPLDTRADRFSPRFVPMINVEKSTLSGGLSFAIHTSFPSMIDRYVVRDDVTGVERPVLFKNEYLSDNPFSKSFTDAIERVAINHLKHVTREGNQVFVHVKIPAKSFGEFVPRVRESAKLKLPPSKLGDRTIRPYDLHALLGNIFADFKGEPKTSSGKTHLLNEIVSTILFSEEGVSKTKRLADLLARTTQARHLQSEDFGAPSFFMVTNKHFDHIDPLSPFSGLLLDFHFWWGMLMQKGMVDVVNDLYSRIQDGYKKMGFAFSHDAVKNTSTLSFQANVDIEGIFSRADETLEKTKAIIRNVIDLFDGRPLNNYAPFMSSLIHNSELSYQSIESLKAATRYGFVLPVARDNFIETILPRAISILQRACMIKEISSSLLSFNPDKNNKTLFFELLKPTTNPFTIPEHNPDVVIKAAKAHILRLQVEMEAAKEFTEFFERVKEYKTKYTIDENLLTEGSLVSNSSIYYPPSIEFVREAMLSSLLSLPQLTKQYPPANRMFLLQRNLLLPSLYSASDLDAINVAYLAIKGSMMPTNFFKGFYRGLMMIQEKVTPSSFLASGLGDSEKFLNEMEEYLKGLTSLPEKGNINTYTDQTLARFGITSIEAFRHGLISDVTSSLLLAYYFAPIFPLKILREGNFYHTDAIFSEPRYSFLAKIEENKIGASNFTLTNEVKVVELKCKTLPPDPKLFSIFLSKNLIVKKSSLGASTISYEYDLFAYQENYNKVFKIASLRRKKDTLLIDLDNTAPAVIRAIHGGLDISVETSKGSIEAICTTVLDGKWVVFSIESIEYSDDFPFDLSTLEKNLWQSVSGVILKFKEGNHIHVNNEKDEDLQILIPLEQEIKSFKLYKSGKLLIEHDVGQSLLMNREYWKNSPFDLGEKRLAELQAFEIDVDDLVIEEIEIDTQFKNNLVFETASLIFSDEDRCFSLPLKKSQEVKLTKERIDVIEKDSSILYFLASPDPEPAAILVRVEMSAKQIEIPAEQKDLLSKIEQNINKIETIKAEQPDLYENNASVLDAKLEKLEARRKEIQSSISQLKAKNRRTIQYEVGRTYSVTRARETEIITKDVKLIAISKMAIEESGIQLETFDRMVRDLSSKQMNVIEDDSIFKKLIGKQQQAVLTQITAQAPQQPKEEIGEIDTKPIASMLDLLVKSEWAVIEQAALIIIKAEKQTGDKFFVTITRKDENAFKTWVSPEAGVYASQQQIMELLPKKWAESMNKKYPAFKIGGQTFYTTPKGISILRFFFDSMPSTKEETLATKIEIEKSILEFFNENWKEAWIKAEG
jgi:hypothetical protein